MDTEIHEYWQQRLAEAVQSRDELCEQLRQEVARLQNRCHELATVNSMGRASVAMDVREFAVNNSARTPNGVMAVPLEALVDFLHDYSNGLVPQLPREAKRTRGRDDDSAEHGGQGTWAAGQGSGSSSLQLFAAQQRPRHQFDAAAQPVTPTVAQLIALRQQQQQQQQPSSLLLPPPQQQQQAQPAASSTFAFGPSPNNQPSAAAFFEPEQEQQQQHSSEDDAADSAAAAAAPSTPTCTHQFLMLRNAEDVDPRKRRDRGDCMDDESVQLRPWLFSRVP